MKSYFPEPQTFVNQRGDKFKLSLHAIRRMLFHVQDVEAKGEAGGVLLGRFILDCADVVVDKVTCPMPGDRRGRYRFFRAARRHQQAVEQAWHGSNGTCNYLGEWHTHPEPLPSPSSEDLLGWRRKLRFDRVDSRVLYFVIVGTTTIGVWQGDRGTLEISNLKRLA